MRLKPIQYLWQDWIPRGMISLLGAVPGAGKSYVALDLCRRIVAGEPFPDGAKQTAPNANIIYVDAELVPQITNERASAWKMDKEKLYLMMPKPNDCVDFARQDDRDTLIEMTHAIEPALIVIDSLSSISSKGENNVEDVRQILSFLNALANDFQIALLLIHHLRKRNPMAFMDMVTIDDLRGSGHIIAMSRSVLALSVIQAERNPDRNGPRRLEIIKTNLNRYPEPLGVTFKPLHPTGIMLEYGECPTKFRESSEAERCMEWLIEMLSNGEMGLSELVDEGMYSKSTIVRARERLSGKIANSTGRKAKDNKWKLAAPGQE